jgi:bifunctional non-homologous end joining protein LigD
MTMTPARSVLACSSKLCKMGLEGIVSKHRDSTYKAGRSRHWIKVKNRSHPAMERVKEALS